MASRLKFVTITNRSYGNNLKGQKVYYEGAKPSILKPDGSFSFGKNILEILKNKFGKDFKLILTERENSSKKTSNITNIRISLTTLRKMYSENFSRSRDIKIDIIESTFQVTHPDIISTKNKKLYSPGVLSKIIDKDIISKLSSADKNALNSFLPDYVAKEASISINKITAKTQIKTLKEFVKDMRSEIGKARSEQWWQAYIKSNILIIQQGYIKTVEKMNITVGTTKYPDFSLITHDSYLDILEIKKPSTPLIKHDSSRDNYFWDAEISKALIQVENYVENITKNAHSVRSYLKDHHQIDLQILRPRGIILAGTSAQLGNTQKKLDDYRILSQSMKNIVVITYDELLTRLENYIHILGGHNKKKAKKAPKKKSKKMNNK